MEKQALRASSRELRARIEDKENLSKLICLKAKDYIETNNLSEISCYFPILDEVDTRELIDYCLQKQKNIYLPHIYPNTEMKMIRLTCVSDLQVSKHGLSQIKVDLETLKNRELNLGKLEVIFTPLLAYDSSKNRLGYGKGYYDKFFSQCPSHVRKIGLAFSGQETSHIPSENHDIVLDLIITEKAVF